MRARLLITCAVVPLLLWLASPLISDAQSPGARASKLQKKIDVTRQKIGRRKGTERVLTTEISGYSRRINVLQGRISRLAAREARVQTDLGRKQAELDRIRTQLRKERSRLVRLRARFVVARDQLADRLVELYQADRPDLVTVVLNSHGFADLLERGEFLKRINDQDKQVVRLVRAAKAEATAAEHRFAGLEKRQRAVTLVVQQRRDELAAVKQDLVGTRVGYQGTRADKQRALGNVKVEREQLEGSLSKLRAQQAKIRAALASAGAGGGLPAGAIKQGSGALIWPVNGPITSQFCETRSWERCHPGIDIGVPTGTPIRAAAAGKVALMQSVGESGGYGNFTCVQHTAAMATCYAHQSRFATSPGASVSQGQVIGYVGCTGLCFGDHLHFEVRVNGAVTNPLNYL
jgi:murein DD-endopeptidase MepM/ murein hydrolase activator NlpD